MSSGPGYCGDLLYPSQTLTAYFGKGGDRQVAYFEESLRRANLYLDGKRIPDDITPRVGNKTGLRGALQYYADEMFLTLYAFVSLDLVDQAMRGRGEVGLYSRLLDAAFEEAAAPTVVRPRLWLECPLSAPKLYVDELREQYRDHCDTCHPVAYRRWLGRANPALEGATHTDALLALDWDGMSDKPAGPAVMFEAKFLSDISSHTSYAPDRDQLTRNLDAGLEYAGYDADRFWYVFVTPECFKVDPASRFYGYKLREFMDARTGSEALAEALPHLAKRGFVDFAKLSRHIGWITWQDICRLLSRSAEFAEPAFPRDGLERFFGDRCLWPEEADGHE